MSRRLVRLGFLSIALAAVLGLATLGTSTTAVDPPPALAATPLEIVGHLGGAPHDVVLQGGYAYLATGYAFEVWDLREPARPVRVGELPRAGYVPPSDSGILDAGVRVRLDGARMLRQSREITEVRGEHDTTRFRHGNDEGIDRRTSACQPPQRRGSARQGFGHFLDDVAALEETVHECIASNVSLQALHQYDGRDDRWPSAEAAKREDQRCRRSGLFGQSGDTA
jgi:hypothetical protein